MVHYFLATLAFLAVSTSVSATPTAEKVSVVPFTFVQWIKDIIAEPNGDHMSPEEAVAAKNAAVAAANPLEQRAARCQADFKDANVSPSL